MPTYRYRCGDCGKEFEVWQSITDDPLRTHDHGCGGELVKVLTPAGIVLKGSGFYRNDSRSGSKRGGGNKSSGHGSGDGSSDGGDDKSDQAAASKDGDGSKSSSGGESSSSAASSTKP